MNNFFAAFNIQINPHISLFFIYTLKSILTLWFWQ